MLEEFLFTLIAGQDFGDLALLGESNTRTCTIKATSDQTKLIELTKEHFLEFIGEYKTESVSKIMKLFEDCMLFKGISNRSKNVLASKSFYLKYPANTVIIKQGEPIYNIYFICKGSASIVKRVKKSALLENEKFKEMNYMFKQKMSKIKSTILLHVETLRKNWTFLI